MLNNIRSVFRKSWGSFRTELGRREPEDELADLLASMRREMVAARALLPELDDAIRGAAAELEGERRALADCERRRSLAERIGDTETRRVAEEFRVRHQERVEVLERKLEAARAERALRGRETEEMSRRYKEADANRFVLLSQLRTQHARDSMRGETGGAGAAFDEFDRMTERVEQDAAYADALEQMTEADEAARQRSTSSAAAQTDDVEERLQQLKRRMGRQ